MSHERDKSFRPKVNPNSDEKERLPFKKPKEDIAASQTQPDPRNEHANELRQFRDEVSPELKLGGEMLELTRHGDAGTIRHDLGLSAKEFQSCHLAAQSMMRDLLDWRANDTITAALPKDLHYEMDKGWKATFSRMAPEKSHITAWEGFQILADSISAAPNLRETQKESLIRRMHDEIFVEHRLDPEASLRRPYHRGMPNTESGGSLEATPGQCQNAAAATDSWTFVNVAAGERISNVATETVLQANGSRPQADSGARHDDAKILSRIAENGLQSTGTPSPQQVQVSTTSDAHFLALLSETGSGPIASPTPGPNVTPSSSPVAGPQTVKPVSGIGRG